MLEAGADRHVIEMALLSGCMTASSELGACPPAMEYSAEEQRQADRG